MSDRLVFCAMVGDITERGPFLFFHQSRRDLAESNRTQVAHKSRMLFFNRSMADIALGSPRMPSIFQSLHSECHGVGSIGHLPFSKLDFSWSPRRKDLKLFIKPIVPCALCHVEETAARCSIFVRPTYGRPTCGRLGWWCWFNW